MDLSALLQIKKGVTCIIGGGGKTTMAHILCKELAQNNKVVFCTTAKIFPSDTMQNIYSPTFADLAQSLSQNSAVCIGTLLENGKMSACNIPVERLADIADYVIVEADGSKGLPLKAHESYEPVIPDICNKTILVAGIDGIGLTVASAAHRAKLYASVAGVSENNIVTPQIAAKVINKENLHTVVFINKVSDAERSNAIALANELVSPVFAGSLQKGEWYACNS